MTLTDLPGALDWAADGRLRVSGPNIASKHAAALGLPSSEIKSTH